MWIMRKGFKLVNLSYCNYMWRTQLEKLIHGVKFNPIAENLKYPFANYTRQSQLFYCTKVMCPSSDAHFIKHNGVVDEIECGNDEIEGDNNEIKCGSDDIEVDSNEIKCGNDEIEGDNNEFKCGNDEIQCDNNEIKCGNDEIQCDNNEIECGNDEIECNSDEEGGLSEEDNELEMSGKSGLEDEKLNHEVGIILGILRGGSSSKDEQLGDVPGLVSGGEMAKKLKQCGVSPTKELVIKVLSRMKSNWEVAFMFFLWAGKQSGYVHSLREYHSMIAILAKSRKFDTAWSLIDEMRKMGIVNLNTLLIMMRRYSAAHDVTNAINTFHAFKRFDFPIRLEEFHNLLSALTRYKNVQEAEHLFFSNKNTFKFNTKSYNIILNGWCNISPREANRFWRMMINEGIKLDVISYSIIIVCYSKLNKLKEVMGLFNMMKEMGLKPDRKVYNAVIHALAKGGKPKKAVNLLSTMEVEGISPNVVTFNSLIKPLCKSRMRDEAQKVYDEMVKRGLQPTIRTFHAILRTQITRDDIFQLLDKMKKLGCHPQKDTYQLLIKKFCRWRQLDDVFRFWDQMKENGWNDDKSSYIALIHGLFLNGKLEEAHKIYLEMKEKNFTPDAKTDELIQTWLSNKKMAETEIMNSEPSLEDGNHVSRIGKGFSRKFDKGIDQQSPEFRKVIRERGVSFWE